MIEINLLPEELRTKSKKFELDTRYLVYLIPLLLCILVPINVILGIIGFSKGYQYAGLSRTWKGLETQRRSVEAFRKEHDISSVDTKAVQQLMAQRLNMAEKLNKLSLAVPSGVWFDELSFAGKAFTLKGTVVSLKKEEMALINRFLDSLKNDAAFVKFLSGVELTSVQRSAIGGYDVVDFIFTGGLSIK
ncbi:MAG TPA: PilN domain-containing protein [Patescibacteria group bacterium]|nr:PilN domain-containing protein [Patescibacteria group bacterium]